MGKRVLINGAYGKMGQITVKTIEAHPDFVLAGKVGSKDDLKTSIKQLQPDMVIDFTNAGCVFENVKMIIASRVHPIIGTSGLTQEKVHLLQQFAEREQIGGIIAPNFSLGAILMLKCSQEIVKYFPDVEIIEMHHAQKQDSPSGTAMHTAEMLAGARLTPPGLTLSRKETIGGARGANYENIPIHAVRLPGLLAHQEIIFGNSGEVLSLRHDATDRICFMPGILLACQKVGSLNRLVYGLEHVL